MMIFTALLISSLNTCGDYMKAGENVRTHYVDGMENGYMAGQFLYHRILVKHELAGENSEHLMKVLDRITKDTHGVFPTSALVKELDRFCKLDEEGKMMLFLVYPTVLRHMSGGSREEFLYDVKVLLNVTYGEKGEGKKSI